MLLERDPKSRLFDKGTKKKQQTCAMECKETETLFIKRNNCAGISTRLPKEKTLKSPGLAFGFPELYPFVQTFAAVINREASRDAVFT